MRSGSSGSVKGQLLRLSEHRAVAIYLRGDSTWIADFVDGQGVLVDVDTWVRFNCGTPANTYASRRIALESAIPLSAELSARIEALHHAADRHPQRSLPRWVNGIFAVLPLGRVVMLFACRFGACSRYLLGHLSHQRTNPTRGEHP